MTTTGNSTHPYKKISLPRVKRASQTFAFLPLFFFFFSRKVWLFNPFTTIWGFNALFTDLQISLFNNFFIKNKSYGIIYIFKNYFTIIFFSFQFSTVPKQTYSKYYQMDGHVLKKQMHCNFSWLSVSFDHVNQTDELHNINLKVHIFIIIIIIIYNWIGFSALKYSPSLLLYSKNWMKQTFTMQ